MSIDKEAILTELRARLSRELEVLRSAAAAAKEGATHEEAKPENEYDTRGLEQSYLAGAQMARVDALSDTLEWLTTFEAPEFGDDASVQLGACVHVDDGDQERFYFVCAAGAGHKLSINGTTCWVVTPGSPIGRKLAGRRAGEVVEHVVKDRGVELEILSVF